MPHRKKERETTRLEDFSLILVAKIEKLESQIETASSKLEAMETEPEELKRKKEERDYRVLLDFMKENDISAGEAVEALQSSGIFRAKQEAASQENEQDDQQ